MREPENEMEACWQEMEAIEAIHGHRPYDEMPAATQERYTKAFERWEELFLESLADDEEELVQ